MAMDIFRDRDFNSFCNRQSKSMTMPQLIPATTTTAPPPPPRARLTSFSSFCSVDDDKFLEDYFEAGFSKLTDELTHLIDDADNDKDLFRRYYSLSSSPTPSSSSLRSSYDVDADDESDLLPLSKPSSYTSSAGISSDYSFSKFLTNDSNNKPRLFRNAERELPPEGKGFMDKVRLIMTNVCLNYKVTLLVMY